MRVPLGVTNLGLNQTRDDLGDMTSVPGLPGVSDNYITTTSAQAVQR
jgi:hypothetical protein